MNTIANNKRTLGSIIAVAVAFVATLPAMADGMYYESAPQMKRRAALPRRVSAAPVKVIEKIIERPVIVEKVIEKQVFVDRPVERIVEKQVCVEKPVEIERKVVVEHPKNKKHLIHIGIPFIGLDLF